jgi:hypothetical protein
VDRRHHGSGGFRIQNGLDDGTTLMMMYSTWVDWEDVTAVRDACGGVA